MKTLNETGILYDTEETSTKEGIQLCIEFMESFMQEKQSQEIANTTNIFQKKINYLGSNDIEPNLYLTETQRAVKQKEKNEEFIPYFRVVYKALKVIHQKL